MKAQASVIGHTITIVMGIAMIILAITSISFVQREYDNFITENSLKNICSILRTTEQKLYQNIDTSSNISIGMITLNLPEKISNSNYIARVNNSNFLVESGNKTITCKSLSNFSISGRTTGGITVVEAFSNNTLTFKGD